MRYFITSALCLLFFMTYSCGLKKQEEERRIFYVNSYHPGYGSSDDIMTGMKDALRDESIILKTYFMDSKRNNSLAEIEASVKEALLQIKAFNPDLIMVSDDNAVKYLIQPYFNNSEMPVVFCGVNWSDRQYSLGENVCGVLEVLPVEECINEVLNNHSNGNQMHILSENSLSEQNNKTILDTLFQNLNLEVSYYLVDNFEEWKNQFKASNASADFIYLPTNGAIKNWNKEEATLIVEEELAIPCITCDDFMMPYAVFGLTKVASEQGELAAQMAIEILNGSKPDKLKTQQNVLSKAWLNQKLAKKIDLKLSKEMQKRTTILN